MLLRGGRPRRGPAGRRRSASRRRSSCRPRRSSSRRWTATSGASPSRCASGRARSGRSCCPRSRPRPSCRGSSDRVVPPLEALLAAALERDALLGDVVETRALRRTDVAQDRAAAGGLARPALAADGDPHRRARRCARRASSRRGARRARGATSARRRTRLSRLIDKLLDLSRLEARRRRAAAATWCSLEEVIRAAVDELGLPPGTFSLSLDPDLPLVRADAAQLERAFANLLENARRHSGGHPVSGARPRRAAAACSCASSTAARGSRRRSWSGSSSRSTARAPTGRGTAARASGWRSCAASSRPTAGACGWSRCPARAPRFVVELPLEPAAPTGEPAPPAP